MKRMLVALVAALSAAAVNAVEIGTLTWTGGTQSIAEDTHVTNLVVNGATTVTVAKGVTLTVDFLKGGKELTKKGNGAFVLKDFDPVYASSGLNIVKGTFRLGILGGGLAFPTISAAPFTRLDATVSSSLTLSGADVSYWGTVGGGKVMYNVGGVKPKVRVVDGKTVVDFGAYTTTKADGSGLQWNTGAEGYSFKDVRETFIVVADTEDVIENDLDGQWYFGDDSDYYNMNSSCCTFIRGKKRALGGMVDTSRYPKVNRGFYEGLYEVDGKTVSRDFVPSAGLHVIRQRYSDAMAEADINTSGFVGYHKGFDGDGPAWGGVRIAEALTFNGKLTDADALTVTRYLMAKWLDRGVSKTLGTLKVSGDAVLEVVEDSSLTVGTLTVDGALKKIGAGSLHATVFNKSVGNVETAEGAFTYDSVAAAVGDAKTSFDVPANGTVQASRVTADGTFTKTGAG
ncbi:MAG: hypothetical protein KBT68_06795, partial [bacterium]|nr:hypothetical protein [Candidatus Colisoma equi]